MMKIEIEKDFPQYFKPAYPEEFELFSHFEVTAGIPTVLFAVTTWKENGKPNVCFHSWSCFHGDKTAFFAVMGNLYQHTHTYANIQREKCFCINFLPISCYDRLVNTIHQNEWDDDEYNRNSKSDENLRRFHGSIPSESPYSQRKRLWIFRSERGGKIHNDENVSRFDAADRRKLSY